MSLTERRTEAWKDNFLVSHGSPFPLTKVVRLFCTTRIHGLWVIIFSCLLTALIILPLLIRLCLTLLIVTVSLSYNWKKCTTCFSFSDYARNQIKEEYVRMKYFVRWLCSIEINIKARWKLKRKFQHFDWTLKFTWIQIARDKIYQSNWSNCFVNKEGFAFQLNIRILKNQYHRRFYIFTKLPFERIKFKKVRC